MEKQEQALRQRKKEDELPPRERPTLIRDEPTKFEYEKDFSIMDVFKAMLGLIAFNFVLSYFITGTALWGSETKLTNFQYLSHVAHNPWTHDSRVFSEEELSKYDGTQGDQILVALNGSVYDVSSNPRSYGPLGGYHFFAGKDAVRAFVTGCFKTDLTHDLRGLDQEQAEQIVKGWQKFFENSHRYWKVGTVVHPSLEGTPEWPVCENGRAQPEIVKPKPNWILEN